MNRYLLPLFAATLIASGCASAPATTKAAATETPVAKAAISAAEKEKANAAIAAAEKSRDAAAAAGYEWRDTSEMIADAKKALAEGDADKAIALANSAEHQGVLAVKQKAIEEQRVGKLK